MKAPNIFFPRRPVLKLVRRNQSVFSTPATAQILVPANAARHEADAGVQPAARSVDATDEPRAGGDVALQRAWAKLHRTRELFEGEQSQLRVQRIMLEEREASLSLREAAVATHERQLAEREAALAAMLQT